MQRTSYIKATAKNIDGIGLIQHWKPAFKPQKIDEFLLSTFLWKRCLCLLWDCGWVIWVDVRIVEEKTELININRILCCACTMWCYIATLSRLFTYYNNNQDVTKNVWKKWRISLLCRFWCRCYFSSAAQTSITQPKKLLQKTHSKFRWYKQWSEMSTNLSVS